jgi:hypothetical protein
MVEVKEVFDMFEVDCPQRPGTRYIPLNEVENFFIQVGLQMEQAELKDHLSRYREHYPEIPQRQVDSL